MPPVLRSGEVGFETRFLCGAFVGKFAMLYIALKVLLFSLRGTHFPIAKATTMNANPPIMQKAERERKLKIDFRVLYQLRCMFVDIYNVFQRYLLFVPFFVH